MASRCLCVSPHMHLDNFFFKWHNNIFISKLLRSFLSFFLSLGGAWMQALPLAAWVLLCLKVHMLLHQFKNLKRQGDRQINRFFPLRMCGMESLTLVWCCSRLFSFIPWRGNQVGHEALVRMRECPISHDKFFYELYLYYNPMFLMVSIVYL